MLVTYTDIYPDHRHPLHRSLSEELGIDAKFIFSNVYDLPDVLGGRFDVVFTSYGVLTWLPDLDVDPYVYES